MLKISVLGLDLAKTEFHFVQLDANGNEVSKRKLRRRQVSAFVANHAADVIAMEACGGAHYWARQFKSLGKTVLLLPPQHVRAYQRGQKNDFNDARAIAEACQHNRIRPVQPKTVEQQDEQTLLRMRHQRITERTRLVNQIRGLLMEYGIVIKQGIAAVREQLPGLLEDAENGLTDNFRTLLARQQQWLLYLEDEISWYNQQLKKQVKQDEVRRNLKTIPAFGDIVASEFKCWIGDGKQFKRGRDASAAIGIVPRQHTTGGKIVLLGITRRGNSRLRSALIHGARAVATHATKKTDPLSRWINQLVERRGFNRAVVALANKLIRIAWACITRQQPYSPETM